MRMKTTTVGPSNADVTDQWWPGAGRERRLCAPTHASFGLLRSPMRALQKRKRSSFGRSRRDGNANLVAGRTAFVNPGCPTVIPLRRRGVAGVNLVPRRHGRDVERLAG
jgi:hypothetical protein